MKLTIRRGGGIAGIVARTELDAADLPLPDQEEFAVQIERSGLRELREPPATDRRPDDQLHEISWQESGDRHSLHYTEKSLPEGIRLLIAWVDGRAERTESIEA